MCVACGIISPPDACDALGSFIGSLTAPRRSRVMHSPLYYRSQATIARRLASKVTNEGVSEFLNQTAKDYADIALDLEAGVVEIRHPDLVRQQR